MDTETYVHTLVVSDLHIGGNCKARRVSNLLDDIYCDRLIINGDLFEKGRVFNRDEVRLLDRLRYNNKKLVCVAGNHDPSPRDSVWRFVGVKPVKKFLWEAGGKKFCAMHGHQFDKFCFVFNTRWIDKLCLGVVWLVRQVDHDREHIARLMDKIHNRFSERLAKRARRYALKHDIDTVICGHTHSYSPQLPFQKEKPQS